VARHSLGNANDANDMMRGVGPSPLRPDRLRRWGPCGPDGRSRGLVLVGRAFHKLLFDDL
jgi:hypothetical protein